MIQNDVRLDLPLSSQAKATIEEAAVRAGQSLSDFALSALLAKAQEVLEGKQARALSERDARLFLSLLDSDAEPNQALREAAAWYKEHHADLGS